MTEKKLSEVVPDVINNIDRSDSYQYRQNIIDWDKIWAEISGDASNYSYFLKFKDGQLIVVVKNSAWVLELKKRKQDILRALRERTRETIKEIRFVR